MPWQQQGTPRRGSNHADPTNTRFGIVVPHERDGRDIGIQAESPTHGDHIADQGGLLQCRVKEREANARVRHQLEGAPEYRSDAGVWAQRKSRGSRNPP